MDAGAPVIYQAHLVADGWHGYPDFLFRCPGNGCPCGGQHYTPWDTKLARSAKPYFLVQLCAYADMLEAVRGYRPGEIVFVLGQGDERVRTDPRLLLLLPPAPAAPSSRFQARLEREPRARPRARPRLGPLGGAPPSSGSPRPTT